MNRSKIRELAFELLYSLEIQKVEQETIEEQIEIFLKNNEITDKKVEEYFMNSEGGCLLGNFALEISNNIPLLKQEIIEYFKNWEEAIYQILKLEIGEKQAKEKATQIVSATQGSIMLMRIYGDSDPFIVQNRAIIEFLA